VPNCLTQAARAAQGLQPPGVQRRPKLGLDVEGSSMQVCEKGGQDL